MKIKVGVKVSKNKNGVEKIKNLLFLPKKSQLG
jgi:hypothetical protein